MTGRTARRRQTGSALLLVLGGLTLASTLAMALLYGARTTVERARIAAETATARHVAESLVHRLATTLADDAARSRLPLDGLRIAGRFLDTEVAFRIRDEQGKIDLNHAAPDLLAARLLLAGAAPASVPTLIDAWLDWRDADDARRLHGAEAADYQAAGLPQRPRNGPLAVIEEFRQIRGVAPDLFESLADDLTVHSGAVVVDPWTASAPTLLAATGARPGEIEQFIADRRRDGRVPLPAGLTGGYLGQSNEIAYRITAEAHSRSGAVVTVAAIVGRGARTAFLDWR